MYYLESNSYLSGAKQFATLYEAEEAAKKYQQEIINHLTEFDEKRNRKNDECILLIYVDCDIAEFDPYETEYDEAVEDTYRLYRTETEIEAELFESEE